MTVRAHFLTAVFTLARHYKLLLVPVVRAVLGYVFGLGGAFVGAGPDAAVITLLILYCIGKWQCAYITADNDKICFRSGVLFKESVTVKRDCISSVSFRQGLVTCLFECGTLYVYTEDPSHPTVRLCVCERSAKRLFPDLALCGGERSSGKKGALLAIFSANSKSGLLLTFAGLSVLAGSMGVDLREPVIERYRQAVLSRNVVLLLLLIAAAAAAGLIVSVTVNFFRYAAVRRDEKKSGLRLKCGVISRLSFVSYAKPTAMLTKSSLFLRRSGLSAVYEAYPGLNAEKHGRFLSDMVFVGKIRNGEKPKSILPFITAPAIFSLLITAAAVIGVLLGYITPLISAAVLPVSAWLIFCGVLGYKNTSLSQNEKKTVVCFARNSHIMIAELEKGGICMAKVMQNPFQQRSGRADVRFFLPFNKAPAIGAKDMDAAFCRKICENA